MANHVHHDLIVAWAKGAKIQVCVNGDGGRYWHDVDQPSWDRCLKYRIKPKDKVKKYRFVYQNGLGGWDMVNGYFKDEATVFDDVRNPSPIHQLVRIVESVKEFDEA